MQLELHCSDTEMVGVPERSSSDILCPRLEERLPTPPLFSQPSPSTSFLRRPSPPPTPLPVAEYDVDLDASSVVNESVSDSVVVVDRLDVSVQVSVERDMIDVGAQASVRNDDVCLGTVRRLKKKNVDYIRIIRKLKRELRESRDRNEFLERQVLKSDVRELSMKGLVETNRDMVQRTLKMNDENRRLRCALSEKRKTCVHMSCDERGVNDLRLTNVGENDSCWERCKHLYVRHVDRICCSKTAENL